MHLHKCKRRSLKLRDVIKMFLIAGNELNKEKLTYERTKNSSNYFLFSNCIFSLYRAGYKTFW